MKLKRSYLLLIIISSLLILSVIGYLLLQSEFLLERVRRVMISQLQRRLDADVYIGPLSGNLLRYVVIGGFTVRERAGKRRPLISADYALVDYRLIGLLRGKLILNRLQLASADVRIEIDRNGRVNLIDIYRKKLGAKPVKRIKPPSLLVSNLIIKDSSISIDDRMHGIKGDISGITLSVRGGIVRGRYNGNLKISEGYLVIGGERRRLSDIRARFRVQNAKLGFSPLKLSLDLFKMKLGCSSLKIKGEISNLQKLAFHGTVESDVNLEDLSPALTYITSSSLLNRMTGRLSLSASAKGNLKDFSGDIQLEGENIQLAKTKVDSLNLKGRFTSESADLTLSLHLNGGSISGPINLRLVKGKPYFKTKLQIESLILSKVSGLFGRTRGKITISGSSLDDAVVEGEFRSDDFKVNGVDLSPMYISFGLRQRRISGHVKFVSTEAILDGQIEDQGSNVKLDISITSNQVAPLANVIGLRGVTGSGEVKFTVRGSPRSPKLKVKGQINRFEFNGFPFGIARFDLEGSLHKLNLARLEMNYKDLKATISGDILDLSTIDFQIQFDKAPIRDYAQEILPGVDVTGYASGEGQIHGKTGSLNGAVNVSVDGLTAYGLTFQPAQFKVLLLSGKKVVPELELMSSAGPIRVTAELSPDGQISIRGEAGPIDISQLLRSQGISLPITGNAELAFKGQGKSDRSFNLLADATLKEIRYKSRSLGDIRIDLKAKDEDVEADLKGFMGTVQGKVRFQPDKGVNLDLKLSDVDISPFLPSPFSGSVSAIAKLAFKKPSLWGLKGSVTLRSLSISSPSGRMRTVGESHLIFGSETISVDDLQMVQGNGGRVSISGSLAQDLSDLSISLSRFIVGMFLPDLEGALDMDLRLVGNLSSPRITLALSSPKLKIAKYERIQLDKFDLRSEFHKDVLFIRRFKFDLPGGEASISGAVPLELDLERVKVKPLDKEMDLRFEGRMASDALSGMISGVQLISGGIGFSGRIKGTPLNPKLDLNLKLNNIEVEPYEMPYLITSLDGELRASFDLKTGRMEVNVNSNALCDLLGGEIYIRGVLSAPRLHPFEPTYNFNLTCRSAELSSLIRQMVSRPDLPLGVSVTDLKAEVIGRGFSISGISANASFHTRVILSDEEMKSISPINLTIKNGKAEFPTIELRGENSTLLLSGWIDLEEHFQASLIARLPMSSISSLISNVGRWNGTLDLKFEGGGILASPVFKVSCSIAQFTSEEIKFQPTISLQAEYFDSLFKITDLWIRWNEKGIANGIRISGEIPAEADLRSRHFKLLDQPLSISVKGNLNDLSFFSLFSPSIIEIKGRSEFELDLEGSSSKLLPKGRISLRADRLILRELIKPIKLSMEISAKPGSLRIEPIELSIGKGKLFARATYSLDGIRPSRMEAHVKFQGIRIEDLKHIGYRSILNLAGEVSGEASMISDISSLSSPRKIGIFGYLEGILAKAEGELRVERLNLLLNGRELRPKGEITGVLSDGIFDLKSFRMTPPSQPSGSTSLAATMLWEIGETLSIEVSGQLDLSIFPLLAAQGGGGKIRFGFSLKGAESDPTFKLSWSSDKLAVKRIEFSKVSGQIRYAYGKLLVDRIEVSIGNNLVTATGYIPAKFKLPYFKMTYPDKEMELLIEVRVSSLDFIPLIWQDVVLAQGQGNASLTLGGTLNSPSFSGIAEFKSVSFQYLPSTIDLRETEITAIFNNQNLIIDHISGLLNGGAYSVSGRIGFEGFKPEKLEIDGSWNSSLFYRPGLYTLLCSGDLSLRGRFKLPVLTGTVTIEEFRYTQSWNEILTEFLSPSPETRAIVIFNSPLLRTMELNIDVQAPGRVFVDTGIASVEAGFSGKVIGTLNRFVFIGSSDITSGELVYLNHRFKIIEGHIENVDRFRFNPRYVIVAKTEDPIRGVILQDINGTMRARDIEVTITLSGTLDQPAPPILSAKVLNTEPGEEYELNNEDIISVLTTGRAGPLTFTQVSELSYAAADIFRRRAESYLGGMVAGLLGFKEFEIELAPSDIKETRLLFTRELSPKWALTYSSTLQLHSEPRIEIEYQISDHLAIIGERTEQGRYGIDLKLELKFK